MSLTEQLSTAFPDLDFKFGVKLAPLTYFKLGGQAEAYIELANITLLQKLWQFCHDHQIKLKVIGGLSNVIVADEGVSGLVVRLTNNQVTEISRQDGGATILAGAGIKTALLVAKSIELGLMGLEFFLGVPGNLGGAVYNNAHYLTDLISEHITRVHVLNSQGELVWLDRADCDFGYDHSRFQISGEIILEVEFWLKTGDRQISRPLITKATVYRAETQPLGMPSSGCIFQNTPNTEELKKLFPQFAEKTHVPGGFLIDQAGLKGSRVGALEVSQKHAAFIVNHGNGTVAELKELIGRVKTTVKSKFGVELIEEVFFLS